MQNLLGCHQSDLETPALCLDLDHYESIASQHSSPGVNPTGSLRWWPVGDELSLPPLAAVHRTHGAAGLSFSHLPALIKASTQNDQRLHYNGKISCGWQAQLLNQLSPDACIVFECDHYVQAEILSNTAQHLNRTFDVLLEVNVGLNRTGVRPGADGRDLAQGLQSLQGIRVVGFCGDLGDQLDSPSNVRWFEARVKLMTDLRTSFPAESREAVQVHLKGDHALRELVVDSVDSEVTDLHLQTTSRGDKKSNPFSVISSVVSRCKLERAVIDAGLRHIGRRSQWSITETAFGRLLPDIADIDVADTMTTLTLGPESLDLVMGDTLRIRPPCPQLALQLASRLYGVRQGVVEGVWHRDSSRVWASEEI